MATSHHLHTTTSPRRRRLRTSLIAATLLAAAFVGAPAATAAPADDARVEAARSQHDAVAAEIAALGGRVAEAEQKLQRMTLEAEAASGNALAAQAALDAATQEAEAAEVALFEAKQAVGQAQDEVSEIGRQAYMGGGQQAFGDLHLLLDAGGPAELLQQAATLDTLGEQRAKTLDAMKILEVQQARAEQAAQATVGERDRAAGAAAEAHAAAARQLSGAQAEFDALALQRLGLARQLRDAEIRLLQMQGARDAARAWETQRAAREAAAAAASAVTTTAAPATRTLASGGGGAVAPTTGRVTSCYGSRWGTLHAGVDIAAPIGTPVFTPESGVVLQAGPASGFGLAVAVQHGDGTITLYGHVNRFFVSAGQTVGAGEQIAEVGNRGQSTGPHLHFEVHKGGLYANRTNPVPWLNAHGISLGGC
ncbi:Murein DD-endopeptidase MepM and murein hydrolase activator NlpD, contain LysM domain [Blastococcus aurantiacus]|uniref:Murein DD-endopeptidase MepM and murein hydrolase activator NlpD, contain LysM domain n=1 Tax=Blastococcus aurantiacus TaxID=1550231 RepID=A0A1G7LRG2_9ACTN|nr:M23 family metallopeptidase [Blastococcus aurantiacus]SDF51559.1 Murein DD-endopeptidase MepM and murein hydrolase activator NlpD, contain LysM domain [Blastococcus aurantiacus]